MSLGVGIESRKERSMNGDLGEMGGESVVGGRIFPRGESQRL